MKRLLITFILIVITFNQAWGAELLVKARGTPLDNWDTTTVASLVDSIKQQYNSRTQIGDIIVVRPDGWQWGTEECLPDFLVIKLPGISIDDAKKFEDSLVDNTDLKNPILLKIRKYQIPKLWILAKVQAGNSVVTLNLTATKTAFINAIVAKTQ